MNGGEKFHENVILLSVFLELVYKDFDVVLTPVVCEYGTQIWSLSCPIDQLDVFFPPDADVGEPTTLYVNDCTTISFPKNVKPVDNNMEPVDNNIYVLCTTPTNTAIPEKVTADLIIEYYARFDVKLSPVQCEKGSAVWRFKCCPQSVSAFKARPSRVTVKSPLLATLEDMVRGGTSVSSTSTSTAASHLAADGGTDVVNAAANADYFLQSECEIFRRDKDAFNEAHKAVTTSDRNFAEYWLDCLYFSFNYEHRLVLLT